MEAGAPDEPFIPRTDVDPDSVETHAHEFAEAAIHEDTLAAVVELTKLPPEERGEVVRRGLAELREPRSMTRAWATLNAYCTVNGCAAAALVAARSPARQTTTVLVLFLGVERHKNLFSKTGHARLDHAASFVALHSQSGLIV